MRINFELLKQFESKIAFYDTLWKSVKIFSFEIEDARLILKEKRLIQKIGKFLQVIEFYNKTFITIYKTFFN